MGPRRREWLGVMFHLLLMAPVNGQKLGLNEINFSTIGGNAAATSANPAKGCEPVNAFSGGTWCDNNKPLPQIIWYEFPKPITVTKFSFKGRDLAIEWKTDTPNKYQFFGSNSDGQCDNEDNWTVLFEDLSGLVLASVDDIKVEEICNPSKYICYGFKVLDTLERVRVRMRDIRFYTRSPVTYTPKKLFQLSNTEVMAPIRRGAPNCPAHNNFGCDRPDDYLKIYSEQSLADAQIDSRFTFKRKPCECKCLCLDDPLCQAVTIITPQTKIEPHRCLFSSNNAVFDGSTLEPELSAMTYIKRGCDRVNCTMNSICDDSDGTEAAVCGCEDSFKSNGLECIIKQ